MKRLHLEKSVAKYTTGTLETRKVETRNCFYPPPTNEQSPICRRRSASSQSIARANDFAIQFDGHAVAFYAELLD